MPEPRSARIVYLLNRFPVRSETFILREIADHLAAGADIGILSIMPRFRADDVPLPVEVEQRCQYLDMPDKPAARILAALRLSGAHIHTLFRIYRASNATGNGAGYTSKLLFIGAAMARVGVTREDIVHCHFGPIGRMAAILKAAGALRGKLVTTIHGYDISKKAFGDFSRFYEVLFAKADLILPVSKHWKERVVRFGCRSETVRVQHMGIDMAGLQPRQRRGHSTLKLYSVGRMVEKKGHVYALRALADVTRRRPDLALTLEVVGGGPLFGAIADEAAALGMADRVVLQGPKSHEETLAGLHESDVFILPSVTAEDGDMEGVPVSIMEAMALEKPIVSSVHSGIPELVEDGESGFLAPERDVAALSAAIEKLADSEDLRRSLGRAGRAKVDRDFNTQRLGVDLRACYAMLRGT